MREIVLIGCLGALASCRQTLLVSLPSVDADVVSDFALKATDEQHQVSIEAHLHAWQGEPRDLDRRATGVLVRIENRGPAPVRLSPSSFELVSGTSRFTTATPERVTEQPAPLIAAALPDVTVEPGEARSGYVFFPRIVGRWGFMHLRTLLFDESNALLGSIDLPFGSGTVERCSLAYVDHREPARPTNIMFHTCLPPF